MDKACKALLFSCILVSLCFTSSAQTCRSYTFSNNAVYSSCVDLPVLNSFLHWTYTQSSNAVDIAFRHTGTSSSRWVSWAINPNGLTMLGSQSLVAYQNSSGLIHAYTSPVTSYTTTLPEGDLSFGVSNITATLVNNEMTISARLVLSSGMTTLNQVWQEGPMNGDTPGIHPTTGGNVQSMGVLDLLSGQTTSGGGTNSRLRRRNVSASNYIYTDTYIHTTIYIYIYMLVHRHNRDIICIHKI